MSPRLICSIFNNTNINYYKSLIYLIKRDDKKNELSSTIHLLGEILGNVIKEQEGISIFNKIEKIRFLSKSSRGKNKKIINQSFKKLKSEILKFKSKGIFNYC